MKNIIKWILFILIATAAMAAGMFCLAQYLDTKENPSSDKEAQNENGRSNPFVWSRGRHYTKLTRF